MSRAIKPRYDWIELLSYKRMGGDFANAYDRPWMYIPSKPEDRDKEWTATVCPCTSRRTITREDVVGPMRVDYIRTLRMVRNSYGVRGRNQHYHFLVWAGQCEFCERIYWSLLDDTEMCGPTQWL